MKRYIYKIALLAAVMTLLLTACRKKTEESSAAAGETQTEAVSTEAEETDKAEEEVTEPEETEKARDEMDVYTMLQGTVTAVKEYSSEFTLLADDGKEYRIRNADICDVETELSEDVQIAIACIDTSYGEDPDALDMVIALPEQEEWTIDRISGVTTANAMSSFTVKTKEGREISFLKDNCPVEEGALSGDSGDKVTVVFVTSEGMNYPVEIKAGK